MPLSVHGLRRAFGLAALALALIVAGFYLRGRLRFRSALKPLAQKVGSEVQQSTTGFTYSHSEGGRTVFTIHASKAVQFKQGLRATLQDVSIIVYGRQANRYDQIYGSDFEYDPASGEISAHGEVQIDLEADVQGPMRPDQTPPPELKNPIHLRTSGLTFNRNTGLASATGRIEFRVPQASGSAVGASYDSRANLLILQSQVRLQTTGKERATIFAERAAITKEPRQAELATVRIEQGTRTLECHTLTFFLREDNNLDHIIASGDVHGSARGATSAEVRAPQADFRMGAQNALRSAVLTGGVAMETSGATVSHGTAGRVTMDFAAGSRLSKVSATDGVKFSEPSRPAQGKSPAAQGMELAADGVDFFVRDGKLLDRAQTVGAAQVTLLPVEAASARPSTTVITAGRFDAAFEGRNRLRSVHGSPDARIVSTTPGRPDRVSTSRDLTVLFAPRGGIAGVLQQGDVHFSEGERSATAGTARYTPSDERLALSDSPRFSDSGVTTTAQTIRFDRRSGQASAEGDVKTTYVDLKPQPGGALLASSDPIHVTARSMTARQAAGTARYSGQARLWQGANIVQAPTLDFDRDHRTIVAEGSSGQEVSTVFVQEAKAGKTTPVNVTSARLSYADSERRARFEGGVTVRSADITLTADHAEVILAARSQAAPSGSAPSAGQVEQMVGEGHILVQQGGRQARGDHLVYTPGDGKFVLTGGSPSIFDAEHGSVTGDSLTFFSRDDRVLVESKGSTRTVTKTRVTK